MVEPFSSESEWDEVDDQALLDWWEDVWDEEQDHISSERLAAEGFTALAEWVAKREVERGFL